MTNRTAPPRALRRGVVSRLFGEAVLGAFFPSQIVAVVALTLTAESSAWWVVVAVAGPLGLVGAAWSAHLCGDLLVGSVLGVPVLRVRLLSGSVASIETQGMARGTTTVIRIDDVVVERGRSIADGHGVRLGYTRALGSRRSSDWIKAINGAAKAARS